MQVSAWIVGGVIVLALGVVVAGRWAGKQSFLKNRKPIDIAQMYEESASNSDVGFDTFVEVINEIGAAYHIDPRLLRPSDLLQKLYELDSWNVDEGTNRLNEQLMKHFGISSLRNDPKSIIELVAEIDSQRPEKNKRCT